MYIYAPPQGVDFGLQTFPEEQCLIFSSPSNTMVLKILAPLPPLSVGVTEKISK